MYEVEVKLRADHAAIRTSLEAVDADFLGTVTQTDDYYNHPTRDFAETDEALRIRREHNDHDEQGELTYKGPLVEVESKTRRELQSAIGDAQTVASILDALGFDRAATVRKTRDRYSLDGFTVSLDTVEGVGSFVEVEIVAPESAIEDERDRAYDVLRRLGLDPSEHIRTSYLELVLGSADNPR